MCDFSSLHQANKRSGSIILFRMKKYLYSSVTAKPEVLWFKSSSQDTGNAAKRAYFVTTCHMHIRNVTSSLP